MNEQHRIAIIGPEDVILGFQALGVHPLPATTGEEALEHLKAMRREIDERSGSQAPIYALAILLEDLAEQIPEEELAKITRHALPTVLAIPGLSGSKGIGVEKLRRLAEQAVGSDILG